MRVDEGKVLYQPPRTEEIHEEAKNSRSPLQIFEQHTVQMSRDSAVGIATALRAGRPGVEEYESRQGQDFSPLYVVQTGSGAHPASYPMGVGGSFPEDKRQGREADHSPPTSAEVKNTSTPRYVMV
jgi:hypothetical protein